MVQDLRAVNEIIQKELVEVANPHKIMNNIGPEAKWFSVIDLSNAFFFSVPLTKEARRFFGFQFQDQYYTYTRLPQGFKNSPTRYARALERSLSSCPPLTNGKFCSTSMIS